MGYKSALEAAGAEVLAFQSFGSYQGDWWALVRVDGVTGWVHGSYGSCSHCDAFEAEFDYDAETKPNYRAALASFGSTYLTHLMTTDAALGEASRDLDWDLDAEYMVGWVTEQAGLHAEVL